MLLMKVFTVILIAFSLSFQCFVQLGVSSWYHLNREAITDLYCINKDKPELGCKGKCHLKKQLERTSDQQEDEHQVNTKIEWTVFILPEPDFKEPAAQLSAASLKIPAPSKNFLSRSTGALFRPPPATSV